MQFSQNEVVVHNSSDYIRSDNSKRYNALKLENIEKVVLSTCKSTHDYYKCGGGCSHKFINSQVAIDSVSKLRQKIWNTNFTSVNAGRDVRNSVILGELLSHKFQDDKGKYQIQFIINGIRVCKYFYFRSTGLSKRLFNDVISYITNKKCTRNDDYFDKLLQTPMLSSFSADLGSILKNRPSQRLKINDTSLKDNVLAFLDIEFSKGIDFAPENNCDRYTHLSWNELHTIYKSYCTKLCIAAVGFSFFCKVR